jgi:hypothetical protein
MAGANKTTVAKLNRERKLGERRMEKQARKDAARAGDWWGRGVLALLPACGCRPALDRE